MKTKCWIGLVLMVIAASTFDRTGYAQDNKIIIGETITLRSDILNESRTLQISLPRGYHNSDERYPVIYVLDGEGQFLQAVGAIRFLDRVNKIAQPIVVGIPNTDRNRDLYPPTANPQDLKMIPGRGGAEKFLAFLTDELRPYIDKNYRTWPFQILFGHSAAGLFVVHTFLNKPAAFSAYIASSPALWWDDNGEARSAEKILASDPGHRGFLFLSHGQEVELMTRSIANLVKILQNRHNTNLEWKFEVFDEENHESSPHRAIYDGLAFIYKGWRFDFTYLYKEFNPENKVFTAGVLFDHYKNLSTRYGYECLPSESYYNSVGYDLLRQDSVASAIELFKANVLFYPESANVYDSLGEAYMIAGDKARAIENYEKSLALDPENANAAAQLKKLRDLKNE
jgi:predicted alpha/beta superfamily hydrolase